MRRLHHTPEDEERQRFWSGMALAIPVSIALWAVIFSAAKWILRLAGWIS